MFRGARPLLPVPPEAARNKGGRLLREVLVDGAAGGQFDVAFCSLKCLRAWLNSKLDRLESRATKYLTDEE